MSTSSSQPPGQIITVPNPNTPYHTTEDSSLLASISPSTIFLHDGVLRALHLTSLKEFEQHVHPRFQDALAISSGDQMEELMAIGLSSSFNPTTPSKKAGNTTPTATSTASSHTSLLSSKILKLSTLHIQSIGLHHRYQWHILEKMWRYKQGRALEKLSSNEESNALPETEPLDSGPSSGLGFKLSLCLLVPMLELYSQDNSSVALSALQLLHSELASVPVMSLSQENSNSIEKLEDLLGRWAANPGESFQTSGPSAMIALACARGVVASFAKTILMLENLDSPLRSIPVAPILRKLNNSRTKISKPCAIIGTKHVITWPYDDRLQADSLSSGKSLGTKLPKDLAVMLEQITEERTDGQNRGTSSSRPNSANAPTVTNNAALNSTSAPPPIEEIQKHFVCTDGTFLFVTGPNGKGISKMGTGLNGSLQGWVYHNNLDLKPGILVYCDGLLISRPVEVDTLENAQKKVDDNKLVLGVIINQNTLKPEKLLVTLESQQDGDRKTTMTLAMISDGSMLYLVKAELLQPKAEGAPNSEAATPVPVWVDTYEISTVQTPNYVQANPKFLGVPLLRNSEENPMSGPSQAPPPVSTISPTVEGNRITLTIGPNEDTVRGNRDVRRTRSVRITPTPPAPTTGSPTSLAPGDHNTSLNLTLKQLQHAFYFTCGNYLTMVIPNTATVGGGLLLAPNPSPPANTLATGSGPSSGVLSISRQYAPVVSTNSIKPLGFHYHFNLVPSTSCSFHSKQDLHNIPGESSFYHGAIVPEMGATYDSSNNFIWTVNGNFVDCWQNPGHIPPWKENKLLLLGNTTNDLISVEGPSGQSADVKTVANVMLRHVAVMATHFLQGDAEDANIGFGGNTAQVLKILLELLCKYRGNCQGIELISLFLTLQAIVSQASKRKKKGEELEKTLKKELCNVQVMIFCLLNDEDTKDRISENPTVYQEACTLFSMTFDLLYTSSKARSDFFQELYQYLGETMHDERDADDDNDEVGSFKPNIFMSSPASSQCLRLLEDAILHHFANSLNNYPAVDFKDGLKWVVDTPWLLKIIQSSIEGTRVIIAKMADTGFSAKEVIGITANYPVTSVSTSYLNSVVNHFLRSLVLIPTNSASSNPATSSSSTSVIQRNIADLAVECFREVLKAGPIIVESILEVISGSEAPITYETYSATEAILKSSLLANGIPQILGYLSLDQTPRPILDELTEECIQLTVAMSFLAKKMNPGSGSASGNPGSHLDVGDDWSSKVKVPSPWTSKRVFESPHPIRENFKMKETIVIPGARQLYAKLCPQCATQYDYDRLTFLSTNPVLLSNPGGTNPVPQTKKLLEFGGNYYGYGNRFFSGPGWSRNLVKLCDGSSVQYNFEMKSGREHSVPDKALWGYQFTLFPVMDNSDPLKPQREAPESTTSENDDDLHSVPLFPIAPGFATITTLHCIDVIQNISRVLLEGSAPTNDEKANRVLLENKLAASLRWPKNLKEGAPQARKFSQELVTKVKRAVGVPPLQMRMSIIEKLRAAELEELYLQCCMAHIGPNPFLNTETLLSPACESCWSTEPTRDVLREIFRNIDTMFRRLMAFYEMEKMLSQEIEEISNNTKDIGEAFFMDPSFLESTTDLQTLAWICYLDYDKENPKALINDVIAMCTALSADPATPPQLTRTDELVEETHLKCKYLLQATPFSTMGYFGPVYPSQSMVIERLQLIHSFISAHMYNPPATMANFMVAMRNRRERAGDRIKGLDILHKVLECSSPSSVLLIVTSLLIQSGPRLHSILCSGLEKEVLRIFGEVMKTTVAVAEKNPLLHRYTIALLSITAYDRTDENNLVESGLVGVLDQLCAYQTGHLTPLYHRSSPTETARIADHSTSISPETAMAHNKASTLAWAAFQVLASQCASWERPRGPHHHSRHPQKSGEIEFLLDFMEDGSSSEWDEPEHRQLPLQISINITNHLARAAALAALSSSPSTNQEPASSCSVSLAVAIQDVLDLLNNLRTYKIGRAILKQSPCICRLLGLLQDSRLSPRLVLTILKLLHTALPLVDDLDTANFKQIVPISKTAAASSGQPQPSINVPTTSAKAGTSSSAGGNTTMSSFWSVIESTPYTQVASMLLSKLADYLVCGSSTTSSHSKLGSDVAAPNKVAACNAAQMAASSQPPVQGLIDPGKYDRMEVWVHKASLTPSGGEHNQGGSNSSSLIRQLFMDTNRQDLKPTRGTLTELENEFNANGKVLLYTDDSAVAERKALRISQLGHLVTLLPAGWSRTSYNMTIYNTNITTGTAGSGSRGSTGGADLLCKDRNNHLASWDPARPFLSGHVAENLASEIVQLVRALLHTSPQGVSTTLSSCSSRANLLQQSGSSSTSVTSTSVAAAACTTGDTDSLMSEASAHLQMGTSSTQKASSVWPSAVEQIIGAAMKLLPKLCQMQNPTGAHLESYVYSARLVIAALTVLGGFTETIRNGLEVWIVEEPHSNGGWDSGLPQEEDQWEYKATRARVISVSDTCPTAKVEILPTSGHKSRKDGQPSLAVSSVVTVPVCRLVPAHFTKCGQPNLPPLSHLAQIDLAGFLKTLLVLPANTTTSGGAPSSSKGGAATSTQPSSKEFPLKRELPTLNQIVSSVNPTATGVNGAMSAAQTQSESRQIAQAMTIVRLLAEIRTKSMQVLSLWLKRPEFRDIFLGIGSDVHFSSKRFSAEVVECTENLKELCRSCVPSHKTNSLEFQVAWMRLLYRDCTKPPRIPISAIDKPALGGDDVLMRWDLSRQAPKIKSTVFSSISNSLVYTGDYNVSGGNPRGLVLFGNGVIPTAGYYWEATIVSMEDMGVHADLIVVPPLSIGFSPVPLNATQNQDIWKYPSGTVMYTTLGRVIHFKTQDPGSWVTLRLDDDMFRVKAGDTIGIGWEKQSNTGGVTVGGGSLAGQASQRAFGRGRRGTGRQNLAAILGGRGRSNNQLNLENAEIGNSSFGVRGVVYFTLNGRRLPSSVEQSNCGLHPIIHVQKRQMIVATNLGERPYLYAEANKVSKSLKAAKTLGAQSASIAAVQENQARTSTDTATSNADVLLRRVSDSLQDLNLVFNMNINEFDSEPEISIGAQRSGSSSTVSGNSTRARRGDRVEVEEEDELDIREQWNIEDEMEFDDGIVVEPEDDDDDDADDDNEDDDEETTEGASSEPNIRAGGQAQGFRVLPPSPVSGVSTSGSSITIRRQGVGPLPPPPPPPPPPSAGSTRRGLQQRPTSARAGTSKRKSGNKTLDSFASLSGGKVNGKKNEVTAKPPQRHTEYNPIKSLEYFLGHSPTASIKVFQGPRRYVCPCAVHTPSPLDHLLLQSSQDSSSSGEDRAGRTDLDSIDSYEDDDGEDDIHSQLVKAWEQQVFPVIRRRFRNESERRDGLEQIRGALQLGMWDIARQTVEFLYEEGGGLPRDLHFPTLEEVRAEQVRCTMDKLKPGMNVVIRPLSQQQQQPQQQSTSPPSGQQGQPPNASNDVALLPPSYAVAQMLRTFGLTGEVLEVDLTHDLVLVETYIESEGVLVRFWYPVACLDKSQSNKKPMLSTSTVNMFKLHNNLITMEGWLCHLYSRKCYLSVSHYCHKFLGMNLDDSIDLKIYKTPVTEKIGQSFDLESLQILSDDSLSNYPASRDLFTYNLQCESPPLKFLTDPANPSVLFYERGDHAQMSYHLRHKIRECCKSSSPDSLDKLSSTLLGCLDMPEKFPRYDLRLDRIYDLEIHCPSSAFTLVTFKGPQNITAKQLSTIDNTVHPCLHVFSYDSSDISRHPMACYPLEPLNVVMHRASSASEDGQASIISHTATTTAGAANSSAAAAINKTMRKRHSRFPPVMCPSDRVFCSISEICLPDVTAEVQGIPSEFPLALLYVQEFIKEHENIQFENVTYVISRLMDFLDQIHLCPVIKDWIFPLIADLTRIRSKGEDLSWRPAVHEKLARSSTPNRFFLELLLLKERESAESSLPTHTVPLISALSEHVEGHQLPSQQQQFSPPKGGKQITPATLMFHISSFINSHQKSNKSMTEPNFSFYFNSLNDLCLALNEVSEIMVNPYEIIPCSAHPSTESSPLGTPPRRPSTTESGASGLSGSSSSQVVPFTAVTKRPFAKAARKRNQSVNKDSLKILKDLKKGNNGAGTSAGSAEKSGGGLVKGGGVQSSNSEDGFLVFAKASEIEWFNNQVIITRVLKDIVWHTPNDQSSLEAAQVLIGTVLEKLKTPTIHNRLLVIQGAPVNIDGMSIEASLVRALRGCGGVHGNELWINGNSAVVEIRSLAKVNEAYETLKQNKVWYPLEDYVLYPNVTVLRVSDNLKVVTTPQTTAAVVTASSTASSSTSQDTSAQEGDRILTKFLKSKLADPEISDKLSFKAREVLTSIFMSCYGTSIPFVVEPGGESEGEEEGSSRSNNAEEGRVIVLSEEQISLKIPGNLLDLFMGALRGSSQMANPEKDVLTRFGEKIKPTSMILDDIKREEDSVRDGENASKNNPEGAAIHSGKTGGDLALGLGLHGFLEWCTDLLKTRPNLLWKALFAAGYDLRLERVWLCQDPPVIYNYFHSPDKWQLCKDAALISYVDQFSQSLHIDPTRIQPAELTLTESDYLQPTFSSLQGVPMGYLRVRWGMLQKLNTLISKKLLAHGSWHNVKSSRRSLANLLHDTRHLLLYYTKDSYLYKIIGVSSFRGSDTPTPEITLDPVSGIGSQDDTVFKNQLSQVIQQMSTITTAFYCVPPAQGADPALPLSVKFQGEEVLGLSGSFRHFLLNAAKELQSETVKILCRCPSADAGRNKDCFIITPGKLSYGEEDFLYFLGQLIGISIRSDAPLALPLLRATWRSLLLSEKEANDISDDLVESDILCATYLRKLESFSTKLAFENFLSLNAWPKFQYPSMDGTSVVPLCADGTSISVSFSNRDQFIKLIRQLREKELRSTNKVTKILTGLASIVPLPALTGLFTSDHLELRVAGSPEVNLSLLKSHTHYQVGVSENDPHITYFWAALESFSPDELRKFIKFSANLERLPVTCPCQSSEHATTSTTSASTPQDTTTGPSSSNNNTVHVPPFPMKIAPIDMPPSATTEEIDRRLIRVETCLFLIRLPPYSSLQVTRQQLLFAINCREDPLSG